MSSLAFLHPDAAAGPVARSPLADSAAAAGARCEPRDGWEVATAFVGAEAEQRACREAVGWADRSHLGKLDVRGSADALAALLAAAGPAGEAPQPVPLGMAIALDGGGWWCPVEAGRALVLCPPARTAELRDRLAPAALDLTTSFGALALVGPLARETFARFCALDLRPSAAPVAAFRPGSVARTPGFVLREGPERYLMVFGAAYGAYMWEVVADAGTHLGGRPVGADALAAIVAEEEVEANA